MKETTSVSNLTIYFFREKSDHFWNKEKRVIDEFLLKKRKLDAKSYLIDGLIARYGPREDHGPYVNEIRFADDDLWCAFFYIFLKNKNFKNICLF